MVKYNPPKYRIKMVEPIELPDRETREQAIIDANYNVFNLKSTDIFIDLLTDSGTGAMSQGQWASMMLADESYANARSFIRFRDVISEITAMPEIIPTHQGRSAENIIFGHLLRDRSNTIIVSNQSFDTTIGHFLFNNASPYDIVVKEGKDPYDLSPFKGNMDIDELNKVIQERKDDIAMITLVVTNNAGGGQPVSMANIRDVSKIAKDNGILFYLDIARFVENIYFIQKREEGYANKSFAEISKEMFSHADAAWMSAKKDAYVNIGGFICMHDTELANKYRERLILFEGFPSYGGLAGRDLEAIATGLYESIHTDVVAYRINQVEYLVERLHEEGIPVLRPAGGHAAFIDARKFLPHIPDDQYPAQALTCELYIEGAIRAVEIGSLMFGKAVDGVFVPATLDLVRLTIPRRTYEKAHFDYIVDAFKNLKMNKERIKGLKITEEPEILRHFTCKLAPVD